MQRKNEFVRRVLDDWLSCDDRDPNNSAVPRTWSSLAECISDADLPGDLATPINEACAGMKLEWMRMQFLIIIHNVYSTNEAAGIHKDSLTKVLGRYFFSCDMYHSLSIYTHT